MHFKILWNQQSFKLVLLERLGLNITQLKLANARVCINEVVIVELPQLNSEINARIDYRSNTTITISFKKWGPTMPGTIPPTGLVIMLISIITMLGCYKYRHQTQEMQA